MSMPMSIDANVDADANVELDEDAAANRATYAFADAFARKLDSFPALARRITPKSTQRARSNRATAIRKRRKSLKR